MKSDLLTLSEQTRAKTRQASRLVTRLPAPAVYDRSHSSLPPPVRTMTRQTLPFRRVGVHHSASGRAPNKATAVALNQSFYHFHVGPQRGYSDIAYNAGIDDLGRIYHLRDWRFVAAGVQNHNTGVFHVMLYGNYEHHRPTRVQLHALEWLLTQPGVRGLPDLRNLQPFGHREFAGHQSNACPGRNLLPRVRELR